MFVAELILLFAILQQAIQKRCVTSVCNGGWSSLLRKTKHITFRVTVETDFLCFVSFF